MTERDTEKKDRQIERETETDIDRDRQRKTCRQERQKQKHRKKEIEVRQTDRAKRHTREFIREEQRDVNVTILSVYRCRLMGCINTSSNHYQDQHRDGVRTKN